MSDTRQNRYNLENIQSRHACYIKRMSEIGVKERPDNAKRNEGYNWYIAGYKFEDADPLLQSSTSFRQGYERAARIAKINAELYQKGREFFENGINLADISQNYTSNQYFLRGYIDALNLDLPQSKSRR